MGVRGESGSARREWECEERMGVRGENGSARREWECEERMGVRGENGSARREWECEERMGVRGENGSARREWECEERMGVRGENGSARREWEYEERMGVRGENGSARREWECERMGVRGENGSARREWECEERMGVRGENGSARREWECEERMGVRGAVNVGGLENMLQVLRETASLQRLVYVSSFFALGPTDGAIGDSSQEHTGRDFCTEYERTKWVADKVARRAVESEGLHVVLVYPCVIYGPGRISASNLVVKMIADHFQGRLPGLLGSGTRLNNFVHVNDVVLGLLAAHHRGTPGRRYILGGENASMVQLFQAVQRATGKAPPRLRLPLWLVAVLGWVSVLVAKMGGPIPIFTHQSVRAFNHDWAYSSQQAQQDLEYSPLSLEEGLRDTLTWMRAFSPLLLEEAWRHAHVDPWAVHVRLQQAAGMGGAG
ncbi:unnamed protein product [Closterium sp. Naga37s-1]|nr:unnamed protein product [Closterium sp. Naga37s-1]